MQPLAAPISHQPRRPTARSTHLGTPLSPMDDQAGAGAAVIDTQDWEGIAQQMRQQDEARETVIKQCRGAPSLERASRGRLPWLASRACVAAPKRRISTSHCLVCTCSAKPLRSWHTLSLGTQLVISIPCTTQRAHAPTRPQRVRPVSCMRRCPEAGQASYIQPPQGRSRKRRQAAGASRRAHASGAHYHSGRAKLAHRAAARRGA